jgi:heptosyltransferase III
MCLMPALGAISRMHRGASIELMARFERARLLAGRSVVARAHSIDAREVGALFADGISDDVRGFFGEFDRIYSFFASDDSRFRERLSAVTDAVASFHPFRPGGEGHVSEAYLRAIDAESATLIPRLVPTSDDLAAASRVLAESGCGGSQLIVIFPGSGSPAKNWAARKFAELAAMLAKGSGILRSADSALNDTGCVVVLGPAEVSLEPVFREAGVAVLKDLELATVAAVARGAAAFVGNDSGVSHLAAAVGASGVAIFGPTDPARWRPLGGGRVDVIRREPIDTVEVGEVAGALLKIVAARQK